MANILIRLGMLFMSAAGFVIVMMFIMFAFFSLMLIIPGFIIYKTGLQLFIKDSYNTGGDAEMKIIGSSGSTKTNELTGKVKGFIKANVKKLRDLLNRYVD